MQGTRKEVTRLLGYQRPQIGAYLKGVLEEEVHEPGRKEEPDADKGHHVQEPGDDSKQDAQALADLGLRTTHSDHPATRGGTSVHSIWRGHHVDSAAREEVHDFEIVASTIAP